MGKQLVQFATQAAADAYLSNLKANLKTVAGDSAVSVVIDDRTLDQAKVERKLVIQQAAAAAVNQFGDDYLTPDQIQAKVTAAFAAIDAATTNDAVDAVNF
jgi:hypothetical protein